MEVKFGGATYVSKNNLLDFMLELKFDNEYKNNLSKEKINNIIKTIMSHKYIDDLTFIGYIFKQLGSYLQTKEHNIFKYKLVNTIIPLFISDNAYEFSIDIEKQTNPYQLKAFVSNTLLYNNTPHIMTLCEELILLYNKMFETKVFDDVYKFLIALQNIHMFIIHHIDSIIKTETIYKENNDV